MSNTGSPGWFARVKSRWQEGPGVPTLLFGILLPIIAILVELTTRMCAGALFDPLPTHFHTALVAGVPLANTWVWRSFTRQPRSQGAVDFVVGCSLSVAAFYSLMFLPLLPLGAIGIVYFGLGLLVWAPVCALIAGVSMQLRLRHAAATRSRRSLWLGVCAGLLALILADAPATITRFGLHMAVSDSPVEQAKGVKLLRWIGSEEQLLRECYVGRRGRAVDLLNILTAIEPVSPEQARTIYYRVTGEPFNQRPVPQSVLGRRHAPFGGANWDPDQGGDAVGGRLHNLALASSRIDGSIDSAAALGYLEWTMVLRNDAPLMREGRAQIALPDGAVVSRLTLWVDGEEREAAFAARGDVKAAYRRVVDQRRDPVLVTTAGDDRIDVRMFPVPAAGEMKVRIGMTVPIALTTLRTGTLRLPYFHERNFNVPAQMKHSVWIESPDALQSTSSSASAGSDPRIVKTEIADAGLSGADGLIAVQRAPLESIWSQDEHQSTHLVKQTLRAVRAVAPDRIAVVVDGSATMRPFAASIAQALATLPAGTKVTLSIAADAPTLRAARAVTAAAAAEEIGSMDFIGGHDNTGALVAALDSLDADGALLWIHGPQPVLQRTTEALRQRLERSAAKLAWYDVQVAPGPNLIASGLDVLQPMNSVSLTELRSHLDAWKHGSKRIEAVRERIAAEAGAAPPEGEQTSTHLARLWAKDEIQRLIAAGSEQRAQAIALAVQYQLVSPVTGAVVLETQQQYDDAGLTPVPPGTVPTIPEPEEWALIAVALAMLMYMQRRRLMQRTWA